jgi:GAF domain-containing protein
VALDPPRTNRVAPDGVMPLADELAAVYARMSGLLLSQETVATVLGLTSALALETVPGAEGAGVTLVDAAGRRTTAAATDPWVEQADAVQYELGEGPCLAAWAQRVVFRVDAAASDRRWPRWAAVAQGLGVNSTLSAPLVAGDDSLGAMKVYAGKEAAFDADAERLLRLFAAQAAVLVANVQSHEKARRMSEELKNALRCRDVIGQAKGMLMNSRGVDEDGAFTLLAAAARRQSKNTYEVAADMVEAARRQRR